MRAYTKRVIRIKIHTTAVTRLILISFTMAPPDRSIYLFIVLAFSDIFRNTVLITVMDDSGKSSGPTVLKGTGNKKHENSSINSPVVETSLYYVQSIFRTFLKTKRFPVGSRLERVFMVVDLSVSLFPSLPS